ncbi:hypothetical protein BO85DRAFT_436625 [Aspergillus piperis CBS 112811]|uniref:Uncharacterized protein n=1 Tax=Aspergillus piperis CBS 112811 TaxID=1448313 RepID=A0A8G1VND1_9EURO|nr:hypothetical protein BO85DRAFT_436625 [Aspergillus piperis CBS 112811]RAH59676.1 hypothetical protein BO85DRAFT_436625 [Aspergillus piperis CBS 112811]
MASFASVAMLASYAGYMVVLTAWMLPNINALCADWARGSPHGDSSTVEALVTSTTTKPPDGIWKLVAADAKREDCRRSCEWDSETFLVDTPFSISQAKDLASSIEEIAIDALMMVQRKLGYAKQCGFSSHREIGC